MNSRRVLLSAELPTHVAILTRLCMCVCVCVCLRSPVSLLDKINSPTFGQHPRAPVLRALPQSSAFHHKRSLITAGSETPHTEFCLSRRSFFGPSPPGHYLTHLTLKKPGKTTQMEIIRVKHHEVEEETEETQKKTQRGENTRGEMDVEPAEKQRITKKQRLWCITAGKLAKHRNYYWTVTHTHTHTHTRRALFSYSLCIGSAFAPL